MSAHTHSRDFYREFGESTGTPGTLEHGRSTLIGSEVCGVPVLSSEVCATGTRLEHAQPQQPNSAALFVSTALSCWKTDRPDAFNRDVQINDTAYRRLDPEYYAWLRSKMHMAKLAALAGQLAQEPFDGLRDSFNRIHEWAMVHFGETMLGEAVRTLDARDYGPPVVEPWIATKRRPRPERPSLTQKRSPWSMPSRSKRSAWAGSKNGSMPRAGH